MKKYKILYLSLGPTLKGPLPKIDLLLINALSNKGCAITKRNWGRHSEKENLVQKMCGRLGDLRTILLELNRLDPEILYVATTLDEYTLARDVPLLLMCRQFRAKKVLMMHGSKTSKLLKPGHFIYKYLTRVLIRFTDAILLLSHDEIFEWKAFEPAGRYFKIDNPFIAQDNRNQTDKKNTISQSRKPVLLFAGRLIREKGVFDLVNAMPAVLNQIDCQLIIAGGGPDSESVDHLIKEMKLSSNIYLIGYQNSDSLAKVYSSSSIFILPTYFDEGFPTAISEAMGYGLPIITTAIRGVKDHLVEGVNSLYIKPKDPAGISDAILRLLIDRDLSEKMAQANKAKVKVFLPEIVVTDYLDVFNRLLELKE